MSCLASKADPIPSLKEVIIFRSVRAIHSISAGLPRDHRYYKDQGWFDADYYYDTKLSWFKKLMGKWVEKQAIKQVDKINKEKESSLHETD